jgi:hypothetical protein
MNHWVCEVRSYGRRAAGAWGGVLLALGLVVLPAVAWAAKGDGQLEAPTSHIKITDDGLQGFASSSLDAADGFGSGVVLLGDLGGGAPEIAVGAARDEDDAGCAGVTSACDAGAVYIFTLNSTSPYVTLVSKIDDSTLVGLGADPLVAGDGFGRSVGVLDDIDNDTFPELVVGADGIDTASGAVYILDLTAAGAVATVVRITAADAGAAAGSRFGSSVAGIGDLDGNGVDDLAVGVPNDSSVNTNDGSVAVILLDSAGGIVSSTIIPGPATGLNFGQSVDGIGTFDGDSIPDLLVGSFGGTATVLSLTEAAGVVTATTIGTISPPSPVTAANRFGQSVTSTGDLDCDGITDIAVGAHVDDDGGSNRGSLSVLLLDSTAGVDNDELISDTSELEGAPLSNEERFGFAVELLIDLDSNGVPELASGAPFRNNVADPGGSFYILFLDDVNSLPIADAGGTTDLYNELCNGTPSTVSLDGTGSMDADGDPLTYFWETTCAGGSFSPDAFDSTPTLSVTLPDGMSVMCDVTLTVTDNCGDSSVPDTDSVTITNTAPTCTVSLSSTSVTCDSASATVNAMSTFEDLPNNDPVTYAWSASCVGGATINALTPTASSTDVTVDTSMVGDGPLVCTVSLIVTDACGEASGPGCTANFSVTSSGLAFSIAGPLTEICDGADTVFDLDWSWSSSNAAISSYLWETTCGGTIGDASLESTTLTIPAGEASCTVTLTVTDVCGSSEIRMESVSVTSEAPMADAGGPYSADCTGGTTPVALSGTGSSDDSAVVSYAWTTDCPGVSDFDNAALESPTLGLDTSGGAGSCSVFLIVTDDCGTASTQASATVDFTAVGNPPVVTPGGPYSTPCLGPGIMINLDTTLSDPDGGVVIVTNWTSTCLSPSFSSTTTADTTLTFDSSGGTCSATIHTVDVCGATTDEEIIIMVETNLIPTGDAGVALGYPITCDGPTGSVLLDGASANDPEGSALTYVWATNCPDASFDDGTALNPLLQNVDLATLAGGNCNVVLTVTDACGGVSIASEAQVSVLNDPPEIDINGVSGLTIDNDGSLSVPCVPALLDGSDSTDPESGALTYLWEVIGGTCDFGGVTTSTASSVNLSAPSLACVVDLRITDPCGATAFVSFEILENNTPPICDAGGPYDSASQGATTDVLLDGTGSTDAEGDVTYLWDIGTCAGASFDDATLPGATITVDTSTLPVDCMVSLTVTDDCGESANPCTAMISISEQNPTCDAGGPYVAECAGVTTMVQLDGSASAPPGGGGGGGSVADPLTYAWTTDCPSGVFDDATSVAPILTLDASPMGATCNVFLSVTTTSGGGMSSCSASVTVSDTTLPEITCPVDKNRGTNDGCGWTPPAGGGATFLDEGMAVSDNCTATEALTVANNALPSFPPGVTAVIWTVTDAAGNMATCEQLVTVTDDTPPTLQCPPDIARPANSSCVDSPPDGGGASRLGTGLVVSDNCSAPGDITVTNNSPADLPLGTSIVIWTARDEAGNETTCEQTVTVTDDTPPTLICPPDISRNANDGLTWVPVIGDLGSPTVSDNCTAEGEIGLANDAPSAFPAGQMTVVTWTATDLTGNSTTCTQEVTVEDAMAPEITCPVALSAGPNAGCTFVGDFGQPTVVDTDEVNVLNDAPGAFPLGDTIVTWTATDTVGNAASCEQVVSVLDTVAPTVTCPAVINAFCSSDAGAVVEFEATAFDVCDAAPTVVCVPPSGSVFPAGITDVTCTATDASGNSSTCTFSVSVQCGGLQVPGDCNSDGTVDISDGVCLINFLFLGRLPELPCGDGTAQDPANQALSNWLEPDDIDLSDIIALLNWKFLGGLPHHLGSVCRPISGCPSNCGM